MSLLIKALQKAEQSKDAKIGDKSARAGLALELAPQEHKVEPPSAPETTQQSEPAGLSLTDHADSQGATGEVSTQPVEDTPGEGLVDDLGFSLADEAGFHESELISARPQVAPELRAQALTTPALPLAKPAEFSPPPPPERKEPIIQKEPEPATQRAAAASMLSLQMDERKVSLAQRNRRSLIMGGVALILLFIMGGGFYYYLGTLDQPQFVAMPPPPANPGPKPMTPPAVVEPETPLEVEAAPVEQQENTEPPEKPEPSKATPITPVAETRPVTATASAKPSARTLPDEDKRVFRSRKSESSINASLVMAYQAFMAGDDATANSLYRQLLQAEPRNADALLGLAAIAGRQEKPEEAVNYYQRLLAIDPRNHIAQAGLITVMGSARPQEAESQLKSMLGQQPDAAYLHAALAGVYGDQNRWAEAQQAYFQAFRLDSGNPDYAFNLAVSLDQLNKPDLALEYYQKAMTLLAAQGGNVDKTALESRISQLRAALGK